MNEAPGTTPEAALPDALFGVTAAPPKPLPAQAVQSQEELSPAQPAPTVMDRVVSDVGQFVSSPGEIGKAIAGGLRDGIQEGLRSASEIARGTMKAVALPAMTAAGAVSPTQAMEMANTPVEPSTITLPEVTKPETGTGHVVSSIVQFGVGLGTLGKAVGPVQAVTKVGRIGADALRFGEVGALFFNPAEQRLSNVVQSFPALQNPVTEFLQAKEGDPILMGRFKNAIENAGLGAALDTLVFGVGAIRRYRQGDVPGAIGDSAAAEQAAKRVDVGEQRPAIAANDNDFGATVANQPRPFDPNVAWPKPQAANDVAVVAIRDGEQASLGTNAVTPPVPAKKSPMWTTEDAAKASDAIIGDFKAALDDPFAPHDPTRSIINVDYLTNTEATRAVHAQMGDMIKQRMVEMGLNTPENFGMWMERSNAYLRSVGYDPEKMIQDSLEAGAALDDILAKNLAHQRVMAGIGTKLRQMGEWAQADHTGPYSEADFLAVFDALTHNFLNLGGAVEQVQSGSGRLLVSNQVQKGVGATGTATAITREVTQGVAAQTAAGVAGAEAGTTAGAGKLAQVMQTLKNIALAPVGGPEGMHAIQAFLKGGQEKLASYYVNSILGYTTVTVQVASDILKAGIMMPTEQAYKGMYRVAASGGRDWSEFVKAGSQYVGMFKAITDTLNVAGRASIYEEAAKTFRSGRNNLTARVQNEAAQFAGGDLADAGIMEAIRRGEYSHALAAGTMRVVGLPARLSATESELAQQIVYRSKVYADAQAEAARAGLNGSARRSYVSERMAGSFDENGRALDDAALLYSQQATASQPLKEGSLGAHVQQFANDHPLARLVVPFVRTPANLLNDVYKYTPIVGQIADTYRIAIRAGGATAEDAVARLMTGASIWGGAMYLAANGLLTDGGSFDRDTNRLQQETGWRGHSLVHTDENGVKTYHPLDRLDPFGQMMALAGDMHSILGRVGKEDAETLATTAMMAISRDVLSKTYLQNISQLMQAISSTGAQAEGQWARFTRNAVAGFVPSQMNRANDDPVWREVRSVIDALKNRIPGLSESLDRRYNMLGEVMYKTPTIGPDLVSPFFSSEDNNSAVQDTIAHIAATNPSGFQPPPKSYRLPGSQGQGVDLTQLRSPITGKTAYDRWQQLIGGGGDGKPTFREQLSTMMNANRDLWFSPDPDGTKGIQGKRYMAFSQVLQGRREGAMMQLINETPELFDALRADARNGASVLKSGGSAPLLDALGIKKPGVR